MNESKKRNFHSQFSLVNIFFVFQSKLILSRFLGLHVSCDELLHNLAYDDFFSAFSISIKKWQRQSNIPQLLPEYHQETEGFLPFSKRYLIRIIFQRIRIELIIPFILR